MMKTERTFEYESPKVDILEVEVEQGFALSFYDDGVDEESGDIDSMSWDSSW